jgi:hypothetical protein
VQNFDCPNIIYGQVGKSIKQALQQKFTTCPILQLSRLYPFQTALLAVLEVLPVSGTYTGITEEDVAEAAKDFDVLESLRRLAFSEKVPQPKQLELWLDVSDK